MLPAKSCLPTSAPSPPVGPEWLHEIKHDGYRMLAHHTARVRLISRRGLDWGSRFPTIVAAVEALAVRTCIIDGELIACDANGLADFQLLRWRKRYDPAIYCAFDLLQLDGRDMRDEPIETREAELARLLSGC
jgi:ATP-dependent DNA ligase